MMVRQKKMRSEGIQRAGRKLMTAAFACVLGIAAAGLRTQTAWALSEGTYTVSMSPKYTDPVTGKVEDPGNNEAIGQGMTEKLCGPIGLLEVDASGNTYLTVRYYLSQFVTDVSFEERSGGASGSFSSLSFEKMQTKAPVEGSTNIDDKYGYTDYRMKITDTGSTFRGKAYIEPMGRAVVYFFSFSSPVAGSADFITSISKEEKMPETEAAAVETQARQTESLMVQEEAAKEPEVEGQSRNGTFSIAEEAADELDRMEGGSAADPVTGIPKKPGDLPRTEETGVEEMKISSGNAGQGGKEEYHLETGYDLSEVPIQEARKLTAPILKKAVGITGMTGDAQLNTSSSSMGLFNGKADGNKIVMMVLLTISAVLLGRFGIANLQQHRRKLAYVQNNSREENELYQNPEYREAEEKLQRQFNEAQAKLRQQFQEKESREVKDHADE